MSEFGDRVYCRNWVKGRKPAFRDFQNLENNGKDVFERSLEKAPC